MNKNSRFLLSLGISLMATLAVGLPDTSAATGPEILEAVKASDHHTLSALIATGADVDAPQGDGATALHWAAYRTDGVAVDLLLNAGACVNVQNDLGATALWLAASGGDATIVTRLIEAGADPGLALHTGETSLMAASRAGATRAVRRLLDNGAAVNAREHERGQTALMWAAAQRHSDVARLLLAYGADPHARSSVWSQLENTAGNTNGSGNFEMAHGGSSPVLFSARNGDVETAAVLFEFGADVDSTAASGTSALVVATHSGHTDLAAYLLEQGADPNAADAGYTALHAAILRGDLPLVVALLDHGATPDTPIAHGTPGRRFSADYSIRHQAVGAGALWLAAKYGELEMVRLLAKRGASAHVVPYSGESSLQAAMGSPRISQENRRNRVGAPFTDQDQEEADTLEMARLLRELGVDMSAANDQGNTALHDAVRRGFKTLVVYLAEQGAELNATNQRGQTPLALAESPQPVYGTNGLRTTRPEIATFLRGLGASN